MSEHRFGTMIEKGVVQRLHISGVSKKGKQHYKM